MGAVGLLLALLGSISVSDYRAWSATRTVQLTIYQEGFAYESQGRVQVCRRDEIEKVKSRFVEVHSRALRARAKVIRSIVKKDGTVIDLATTLDPRQITELIAAARGKAGWFAERLEGPDATPGGIGSGGRPGIGKRRTRNQAVSHHQRQ